MDGFGEAREDVRGDIRGVRMRESGAAAEAVV